MLTVSSGEYTPSTQNQTTGNKLANKYDRLTQHCAARIHTYISKPSLLVFSLLTRQLPTIFSNHIPINFYDEYRYTFMLSICSWHIIPLTSHCDITTIAKAVHYFCLMFNWPSFMELMHTKPGLLNADHWGWIRSGFMDQMPILSINQQHQSTKQKFHFLAPYLCEYYLMSVIIFPQLL